MRYLLVTSLIAGLAGNAWSKFHSSHPTRKSLSFGPYHPHATFSTQPQYHSPSNGFAPLSDTQAAEDFVKSLVASDNADPAISYRIRRDSYRDQNTGVTHVYVKQTVYGLEVTDGDLNINVKDGRIISYGNSFFKGLAPDPFTQLNVEDLSPLPHEAYCNDLRTKQIAFFTGGAQDQVVLGGQHHDHLNHLFNTHCNLPSAPSPTTGSLGDFRQALLQFMLTATPNSSVTDDILNNYEKHLAKMAESITSTHGLTSDGSTGPELLVENVPDAVSPVKAKMAYVQVPDKDGETHLELVWKFEVQMKDNWYETSVSAASPHNIISVVDWASDSPRYAPVPPPNKDWEPATYNVYKWGINDPTEGNRTMEEENFDSLASPSGWHSLPVRHDPYTSDHRGGWINRGIKWLKKLKGGKHGKGDDSVLEWRNTTTTWGNNVFAQEDWEGRDNFINNYRPNAKSRVFDFKYDPKSTEDSGALREAKKYIDATLAQVFYTTNMVHDLYYRYGFDEVAGNFQQYNFGRGGAENDAVIADAQDGSGYNNANFMTPPDGQNGRMRMYLWNTAIPYRDGDLEAGIVIHELTHGLSIRLTGGPANSGCLGWGESGGMGEGWGDFLATTIRAKEKYQDYAMGAWAANTEKGIRNYIYSLNETVNPSVYKTLDSPGYWGVHAIGEVWAEMLWIVSQELIGKHGYSKDLFPPKPLEDGTVPEGDFYRPGTTIPKHGNTLMVQLVINGMKLQPCRPTFFKARDAIIQADQLLTGGENKCELWAGFANRGLGKDALIDGQTPWGGGYRTNGYAVPKECK